ncbi:MAG: hypothetical protein ACQEXJ_16140 [Myxococcota bacterium]
MTRFLAIATILSGVVLAACGGPCDDLADKTCAVASESSDECKAIRARAEEASAEDRRSCEVALELVESLEKQQ